MATVGWARAGQRDSPSLEWRNAHRKNYERQDGVAEGLHHSDRGVHLSIRYTERPAEAGINASVGSIGDSYNYALVETINGLYKTEVIRPNSPWRGIEDVELATLEWVDWFNNRRLLEPIGSIPPVEFEAMYDQTQESPATEAGLKQPSENPGRFSHPEQSWAGLGDETHDTKTEKAGPAHRDVGVRLRRGGTRRGSRSSQGPRRGLSCRRRRSRPAWQIPRSYRRD